MEMPTTELTHADSMWDLKKKLTNRNSRAQMGDKTTRPRISSRAILSGQQGRVGAGGSVWRIYLPRDGANLLHVTKEVYFSFAKITLYLTPVWTGIWRSETSVGGGVASVLATLWVYFFEDRVSRWFGSHQIDQVGRLVRFRGLPVVRNVLYHIQLFFFFVFLYLFIYFGQGFSM